jgi:DNA-binding CsgD family transcriptional regulator
VGKKNKKFTDNHKKNLSISHKGQKTWNKGKTDLPKGKDNKNCKDINIDEIFLLRSQGKTIKEIANTLNYSSTAIRNRLNNPGVFDDNYINYPTIKQSKSESKLQEKHPMFKNIEIDTLLSLRKSGMTIKELSNFFNVSEGTIKNKLKFSNTNK